MLASLETLLQSRGPREGGELLLDEVFPLEEVGVGLKGGLPLVCGLKKGTRQRVGLNRQFVVWKRAG